MFSQWKADGQNISTGKNKDDMSHNQPDQDSSTILNECKSDTQKNRRPSLAQKMTLNLRRLSGATELKIDITDPINANNPKYCNKKIKRHSIHGMMEEENVIRPHQEIQALSLLEKKYLLAVERGDVAGTRRILDEVNATNNININCVDPLGRSALLMAIDNEGHHSWESLPLETATFTSDITPLILAAHRDNYEIIKILLDRGATLPMPHDVRFDLSIIKHLAQLADNEYNTLTARTELNVKCIFACNYNFDRTGGKKNRQKERRLMKGYNLAPPGTPSMNTLPPVAEFMSSYNPDGDGSDYYGSAFAGLISTSITPRRNHMYNMQQFSSSQSSFSESFGTIGRLGKIGSKLRSTSQKRRWGTLIEAARSGTGSVSRFIGRSRSEDSVCNSIPNNQKGSASRSNSAGVTASPTDSNPSMDKPDVNTTLSAKDKSKDHHTHLYGFGALAALKRKRKKFSKSRNTSPVQEPCTPSKVQPSSSKKTLKRASSVPSRVDSDENQDVMSIEMHRQAIEANKSPTQQTSITPSTTDESVRCSTTLLDPLLRPTHSLAESMSRDAMPHLPNITPVRGHANYQGWL